VNFHNVVLERSEMPKVQQAYDEMMRRQVAPALRELGFSGTLRIFRYSSGGRHGEFRWQKDGRASGRGLLRFTMNVNWLCGSGRVGELMPVPATDTWWEIRSDRPTGPVADSVVSAVRCYILPAILAGLDDPEPQAPDDSSYAGCFRPGLGTGERQPDGGGADPRASYVQPAGTDADEYFADLASHDPVERADAAEWITQWASSDPRTVNALLDRLDRDSYQYARMQIASRMLTLRANEPLVRAGLQRAAADDCDQAVRWAARYALQLDLDRDPGRDALMRWPGDGGIMVPEMRDELG
jgi:hypothetical protein